METTRESRIAKFLLNTYMGVLNKRGIHFDDNPVTPKDFTECFDLYDTGVINKAGATIVLETLVDQGVAKQGRIKKLKERVRELPDTDANKELLSIVVEEYASAHNA